MKRTALFAATIALLGTPAVAQAHGYVGLDYSSNSYDSADSDTWQAEGAFGHDAGAWGVQVDGSIGNVSASGNDADFWALDGHLYWQGDNWRLGGFVGTTQVDVPSFPDLEETNYGVEGTFDFGPNTVASASYTIGEVTYTSVDVDSWNVDLGLAHYFSPNLRIQGGVGFGNLECCGTLDADSTSIRIGGEWQPWTTPVSFTLGYDRYEIDGVSAFNIDGDFISIGARWNFGGGTLQERDNATPFDTRTAFYQRIYNVN